MSNRFTRWLAQRTTRHVARHVHRSLGWDPRAGFALMTDSTVPAGAKALSVVIGGCASAVVLALEIPAEALMLALGPFGFVLDLGIDGLESVFLTAILACIVLPLIAPRRVLVRSHGPRRD